MAGGGGIAIARHHPLCLRPRHLASSRSRRHCHRRVPCPRVHGARAVYACVSRHRSACCATAQRAQEACYAQRRRCARSAWGESRSHRGGQAQHERGDVKLKLHWFLKIGFVCVRVHSGSPGSEQYSFIQSYGRIPSALSYFCFAIMFQLVYCCIIPDIKLLSTRSPGHVSNRMFSLH
ncbi:hypothetical protein BJV74DRAFT_273152 [Russula compacta]|nr:hypothetical protein BJV74DRAFT_273152 [Russula compacta]